MYDTVESQDFSIFFTNEGGGGYSTKTFAVQAFHKDNLFYTFLAKLIAVLICIDYSLKYLNSCAGLFEAGLR